MFLEKLPTLECCVFLVHGKYFIFCSQITKKKCCGKILRCIIMFLRVSCICARGYVIIIVCREQTNNKKMQIPTRYHKIAVILYFITAYICFFLISFIASIGVTKNKKVRCVILCGRQF